MTIYLSNKDGDGKTNEEGHYRLQTKVLRGQVLGASSLEVTETDPLSLSVAVQPGDYRLETAAGWAYTGWIDEAENVVIATADPANPRITVIALYIDKDETTAPTPPNNPGIAKLMAVNGVAAPSPTAPTGSAIQAAVGAGNPYIILAEVLVGTAATQITNSNITDLRELISFDPQVLSGADLQATIGPIMYPIGSLYFNASTSDNPSTVLGFGTWEAYASGRVLVGVDVGQTEFDTLNETGGAKTHTLTVAEMPSHRHPTTYRAPDDTAGSGYLSVLGQTSATTGTADNGTDLVGGSAAHNNLQPYITVRIWRRTA